MSYFTTYFDNSMKKLDAINDNLLPQNLAESKLDSCYPYDSQSWTELISVVFALFHLKFSLCIFCMIVLDNLKQN